jgi:hypothetical protein
VNLGAVSDLAAVRRLFRDTPCSVSLGYVDPSRVAAELEALAPRLNGPDCLASWELKDLIGLESWLGVFFRSKTLGELPHETPQEREEAVS